MLAWLLPLVFTESVELEQTFFFFFVALYAGQAACSMVSTVHPKHALKVRV